LGQDMTEINLPYLSHETDRHGNQKWYVRRHGKRIRVQGEPRSVEFLESYAEGLRALEFRTEATSSRPKRPIAPAAGTLSWLLLEYYQSAEFKNLDDSTQHARKLILQKYQQKGGHLPYKPLKARNLRKERDLMSDRPAAANGFVKAMRQVFKWAIEMEHAEYNPAADVPYLESNNPEGFHAWTLEEIEQFEGKFPIGTKQRLAIALLLYTGVRRSDVIKLGPQMVQQVATEDYAGPALHFREWKGRKRILKERFIPVLPELQRILDATPSGHLTYLVTDHGKPYSHGGFGNWFGRQCRLAGLTGCSAHGLRKAGATIAANNGATEYQLMAVFGWSSPKQAAVYTRQANRKKLTASGMKFLRRDGPIENEIVAPESQFTKSATIGEKK